MAGTPLTEFAGHAVTLQADCSLVFDAPMTIDADGSPRCYHPDDHPGLDALHNALDEHGHPVGYALNEHGMGYIQGKDGIGPAPGFLVATTTYQNRQYPIFDTRRYVDASTVPFIALPARLFRMVGPVVLGCRVTVRRAKSAVAEALVADRGGNSHIGEGSPELARLLKLDPDARHGGTPQGELLEYTVYPGVPAVVNGVTYLLQRS